METTSVQTSLANQPEFDPNAAMDTSMDIDMDLDLGPLPEPEPIELEPAPAPPAEDSDAAALVVNGDAQPEKVHVRGVDELSTDDVKNFAVEQFKDEEEPVRIEWIDDTSANIVYSSTEVGQRALAAFTQPSSEEDTSSFPSLQLRNAKSLSTHPDSVLLIRSALTTDKKKPRAHEVSRFYLMHPEHDPREKMRREFPGRRNRGRKDDSSGDYRRRRFDEKEHRRRKDEGDTFAADMYDDNPESTGRNLSNGAQNGHELFPEDSDRTRGRLRNRSASPDRPDSDRDGTSSRRNFRDRSPRMSRDKDLFSRVNSGKELFRAEANSTDEGQGSRELFPNKTASAYIKKELFPKKNNNSNHRRSDAVDAADETAELFSRRISIPLVDGAADTPGESERKSNNNNNVELFPESSDNQNGINIRGAAADSGDQQGGMSIRGASNGFAIKGAASIRELFPTKHTGNERKELFSDNMRGRRRKKAEEMFH